MYTACLRQIPDVIFFVSECIAAMAAGFCNKFGGNERGVRVGVNLMYSCAGLASVRRLIDVTSFGCIEIEE
jgi:hypothetical protein